MNKRISILMAFLFSLVAVSATPTNPRDIRTSEVTHNSARVSWTGSVVLGRSDGIVYEIKMRTRNNQGKASEWAFHGGCCLVSDTGSNNNSVVVRGLAPETKYEIRIVAYDDEGNNSKAAIRENAFKTLKKPTVYQTIKTIPVGFSMMSIPFKFGDNTVLSIFGDLELFNEYLTIYKYTTEKGFIVNSYDSDFGWDDESMKLDAGDAIWILNESHSMRHRALRGYVPNNWRKLNE
tara:strand:+ start:151 stop:855 length:705 start_codon:yes stop_codon:yes gene_type:complete